MNDLDFIHRFVPGESNRTLLLLHGTGGNEDDLLDLGRAIDANAALLSPRGKVLEDGAPRFFRRLAEGVFDEGDVIARAHELAKFLEAAAHAYKIDMHNLVAIGYSNGANIAAAMMLLGVAPFTRAVLFRPMVPLSKMAPPNLKTSRVLICAGEFDPIAPVSIAQRLAHVLESAGAEVTLRLQSSGHDLSVSDVDAAKEWLALELTAGR
jgi:phospholipase/carboxylesterase